MQSYDPSQAVVGVIGATPRGPSGPLRVSALRAFQELAGELEQSPAERYPAVHAVAHALMNGVSRALVCSVDADAPAEAWTDALDRLFESAPVHAIIAPGLVDDARVDALARRFLERLERRGPVDDGSPLMLWLDAPSRASVDDALALRERHGDEAIGVALPWVPTISPGRRRHERLPATALVTPLVLACATELKGVHEPDRRLSEADKERLRDARVAILEARGRRRLVGLDGVPPWRPSAGPGAPPSLESQIQEALQAAVAPLLDGSRPPGEDLWRWMRWRAEDVLKGYQRRGLIAGFRIKCDAELNEGVGQGARMAVWFELPRRVREVQLTVSAM